MSNVYEKEVGKGKTKAKAQITAWQIKAFSIRKLDRKETVPTARRRTEKTQPEEIPLLNLATEEKRLRLAGAFSLC